MAAPAILLIDNDAFVLLAGAEMLDAALDLLGFSPENVLRLPSLPSMLGRGRASKDYPPDVKQRAQIQCSRFSALNSRPDLELHQQLIAVPNMDDTDAVLYAHLATNPNWMLLSNDKRAMKALSNEPSLSSVKAAVAGRVICFEKVLQMLVGAHSASAVCEAFRPLRPVETVVRIVLSDSHAKDHDQCTVAISHYFSDLRQSVTVGFLFDD